ncbi:hypothetical protein CesoFtcFv8_003527 [Champsocephalus esox]|uniref:Uncharacterized protein n=1 Tax=Champsocephalus esox TaxID=159716 RepID=A0AAN8CU31_9TELE|nr:hypothetical protein CesoFtcFv8_003527 [Champsocephalus esox]
MWDFFNGRAGVLPVLSAAGTTAAAPSIEPLCFFCSSPHRGPSKPRRSVTSHPSSGRTPLVGPSTLFTLGPPFHALVLTVDQL